MSQVFHSVCIIMTEYSMTHELSFPVPAVKRLSGVTWSKLSNLAPFTALTMISPPFPPIPPNFGNP